MTEDNYKTTQTSIQLPTHLLAFCLIVAVLMPYIARLPSVPFYGWPWFTDYFPGIGMLFFSVFNLIPFRQRSTLSSHNGEGYSTFKARHQYR